MGEDHASDRGKERQLEVTLGWADSNIRALGLSKKKKKKKQQRLPRHWGSSNEESDAIYACRCLDIMETHRYYSLVVEVRLTMLLELLRRTILPVTGRNSRLESDWICVN